MDKPLNLQDAILNIQRYLRALSFVDSRLPRVPVDGLFDSETRRAVEIYQRTRGLPETGIVDKSTWDTLFNEYLALEESSRRSPTPNFFPVSPEGYEATSGEENPFVFMIQLLLRELKIIYDTLPEIELNGIFDSATEEGIKIFQSASGLPPTGRVDLSTWNMLTRDFFNYSAF